MNQFREQADCATLMRALWDYLDGRLSPDDCQILDEHIAQCENCRAHTEFERTLVSRITEIRNSAPSQEELRARVIEAIRSARASA